MIGPSDLFHPSPAPHFKILYVGEQNEDVKKITTSFTADVLGTGGSFISAVPYLRIPQYMYSIPR